MEQIFEQVEAVELLEKVKDLAAEGYRLGQICCTNAGEQFELLYSFDRDHELLNIKITIDNGQEVASITGTYWPAFIYENEIHDLFGVSFRHSELDYGGHFFKVAKKAPWNPKEQEKGEQ